MIRALRNSQKGIAAVETAIVMTLFLLVVLSIIEVGRMLWMWESLNEVTRRGARLAAVCPVNDATIVRVALFNDEDDTSTDSAILRGLTAANIQVDYLGAAGNELTNPADTSNPANPESWYAIRYVRVSIINYQHSLLIPLFDLLPAGYNPLVTAPPFAVTVPRESLGVVPGEGVGCFGYA